MDKDKAVKILLECWGLYFGEDIKPINDQGELFKLTIEDIKKNLSGEICLDGKKSDTQDTTQNNPEALP